MISESGQIVIGHNTFGRHVTLKQVTDQLTPAVEQLIESTSWNLYSAYGGWRKLMKLLQSTKLHGLHLSGNHEALVLKQIVHINFACLRQLYLWSNQMRQIESVVRLDAPILTELHLQNNKITTVGSFRKARFPQLAVLKLKTNHILTFAAMHPLQHSKDGVHLELYSWGGSAKTNHASLMLKVSLLSDVKGSKVISMIKI